MRQTSWPAVVLLACGAAALAAAGGWLLEPLTFGPSRDAGFERVEQHVRLRFDELARTLQRTAVSLATDPGVPAGLSGDRAALVDLFELIRDAVPAFVWVATAQSIIDKVARIAMRISGTAH